jgi:hypothetical protein
MSITKIPTKDKSPKIVHRVMGNSTYEFMLHKRPAGFRSK